MTDTLQYNNAGILLFRKDTRCSIIMCKKMKARQQRSSGKHYSLISWKLSKNRIFSFNVFFFVIWDPTANIRIRPSIQLCSDITYTCSGCSDVQSFDHKQIPPQYIPLAYFVRHSSSFFVFSLHQGCIGFTIFVHFSQKSRFDRPLRG